MLFYSVFLIEISIFRQIIIVGTQVLGRAFVQAYKQAALNAALRHEKNKGSVSSEGPGSVGNLSEKMGITANEACQILNIKKMPIELSDVIKVVYGCL